MDLAKQHCVPCEAGGEPLGAEETRKLKLEIRPEWELEVDPSQELRTTRLARRFKFKDFVEAMKFVNKVAALAENEGHHPDIKINYNRVTLELWTHAVKGLSENDFILARKIENIL